MALISVLKFAGKLSYLESNVIPCGTLCENQCCTVLKNKAFTYDAANILLPPVAPNVPVEPKAVPVEPNAVPVEPNAVPVEPNAGGFVEPAPPNKEVVVPPKLNPVFDTGVVVLVVPGLAAPKLNPPGVVVVVVVAGLALAPKLNPPPPVVDVGGAAPKFNPVEGVLFVPVLPKLNPPVDVVVAAGLLVFNPPVTEGENDTLFFSPPPKENTIALRPPRTHFFCFWFLVDGFRFVFFCDQLNFELKCNNNKRTSL